MYTGAVDLDTFELCLPLLNLPVTYNGDIFDYTSFIKLRDRFKTVSRWLIGRGILANPFLPEILRSGKETISQPVERLKKFHNELFEGYRAELSGSSHLVDKMKGYWLYFFRSFENGEALFKKIKKVTTVKKYEELVNGFFEEDAVWRPEIRF
jgi:tRNA-dihydrouridine synthase